MTLYVPIDWEAISSCVAMSAKHPGKCAICGRTFPVGTLVFYDHEKPSGRKITHQTCGRP